jgi:hypothetical protein
MIREAGGVSVSSEQRVVNDSFNVCTRIHTPTDTASVNRGFRSVF